MFSLSYKNLPVFINKVDYSSVDIKNLKVTDKTLLVEDTDSKGFIC